MVHFTAALTLEMNVAELLGIGHLQGILRQLLAKK